MRMHRSFSLLSMFCAGLLLGGVGVGIAATTRGSAIFRDVPEGAFFDEAVGEMYSVGVIKGYTNGLFGPNDFVTRGQVAVMMQRLRDDILESGGVSSSSRSSSSSTSSSSTSSSSSSSSSTPPPVQGAFRFTSGTFSLPETVSRLSLSVQRYGGSEGDVTVKYTVKSGTATAAADFAEANLASLSFKDGETSKTFTISLMDDDLGEGSETVFIELSNPTGGSALGSPSTAILTILDNEAPSSGGSSSSNSSATSQTSSTPMIKFSALAYEVRENVAGATITVLRSGSTSSAVGVSYTTVNKTAYAGSEYTTTNGTLTFAVGETSKTFTVPILDDSSVDGKKSLTLTLSAPTGGAVLGTSSVLLSISDNEIGTFGSGAFMFSKPDYDALEGDGIATLTVNRVGGTLHTVGVTYTTNHATALPGQDFTTTTGTLSFEPGEQSKSFTIPILRDSASDSNEYFSVTLSAPTGGATIDSPSSVQVYIFD